MKSIIKDIRINELQEFINSKEFKTLENIPVSYHRAVSYINNPRADNDDVAFSLLYLNKQLIAYRCLYSDYFFKEHEKIKFAWMSGSWVHPDFRRQGYSMTLLKHCLKLKAGQLMFSNYAPEAKSLNDKSNEFEEVAALKGKRFYFRFCFTELLPPKHPVFKKIKPLLFLSDILLNFIFDIRFLLFNSNIKHLQFTTIESICPETQNFINSRNKQNPFKRSGTELLHAQKFPWVIEKRKKDKNDDRYFFSSSTKIFKYKNIKIYDDKNKISGFLLLKIRNNSMTIPYAFFENNEITRIVKIIQFYIKRHKIKYLTIFNSLIIEELLKNNKLILFSKDQDKKFFAGKEIAGMFEKSALFYDGDGDGLYT